MMKEYFNPQEFQRFGEPDQMSLRDSGRTIGPNNQISPLIPERPFQNFLGGFQDNVSQRKSIYSYERFCTTTIL